MTTGEDDYAAALALAQAGRFREALQRIEQALVGDPRSSAAMVVKAGLELELGEPDAALRTCDAALGLDPRNATAHATQGAILRRLGRPEEGLTSYDRCAQLEPHLVQGLIGRGAVLLDLMRPQQALDCFGRALALDPRLFSARNSRTTALLGMARYPDALASADRALALRPRSAVAWARRGDALSGLRRYSQALENYRAATAIDPGFAEGFASTAAAHRALGNYDEAIASLAEAERLSPQPAPSLRYRAGQIRLLLGDFERGWRDYEARWDVPAFLARSSSFVTPGARARLLLGLTPQRLAGRNVLLVSEQGIGDQLMFLSMLPDLLQVAKSVSCLCDRRLVGLLSNSFPGVLFLDSRDGRIDLPAFDVVVASGDLGRAFRNRPRDFPGHAYLRPRPATVDQWKTALGPRKARLRVGLSWRGGTPETNADGRSIPLHLLRGLTELEDCEFVSLQYGDVRSDLAAAKAETGAEIRAFAPGRIEDFEQQAGLIQNLDLVVSVQTALVHLCGALAKTCFVMAPNQPEWRYGAVSESMPWYRSLRLFRQDATGSWAPVIERVIAAVRSQRAKPSR